MLFSRKKIQRFESTFLTSYGQSIGKQLVHEFQYALVSKRCDKTTKDAIKAAYDEIRSFGIVDAWYGRFSKTLFVKLTCPGNFIGKKGETITLLEDAVRSSVIGKAVGIKDIFLVEETLPIERYLYAQWSDDVSLKINRPAS